MRLRIFKNVLSNFHKITKAVLRETIPRGNPKTIVYSDHKLNDKNKLHKGLSSKMKKKKKKLRLSNLLRYSVKHLFKRKYVAITTTL